jgi:hypothetical protein
MSIEQLEFTMQRKINKNYNVFTLHAFPTFLPENAGNICVQNNKISRGRNFKSAGNPQIFHGFKPFMHLKGIFCISFKLLVCGPSWISKRKKFIVSFACLQDPQSFLACARIKADPAPLKGPPLFE